MTLGNGTAGYSIRENNLAFIDLETTGLLPDKHEILEIGCVVAHQEMREGRGPLIEAIDEFEVKVRPAHLETADPVALKINKYSPERWKLASPLTEALAILSARTKGAIMVGHNVSLDWDFLERAFRATGVECFMDFRRLDTIAIAFGRLYDDPYARKFSLQALCDRFGIVNANPHTALSDARATYELYKQMLNA